VNCRSYQITNKKLKYIQLTGPIGYEASFLVHNLLQYLNRI